MGSDTLGNIQGVKPVYGKRMGVRADFTSPNKYSAVADKLAYTIQWFKLFLDDINPKISATSVASLIIAGSLAFIKSC